MKGREGGRRHYPGDSVERIVIFSTGITTLVASAGNACSPFMPDKLLFLREDVLEAPSIVRRQRKGSRMGSVVIHRISHLFLSLFLFFSVVASTCVSLLARTIRLRKLNFYWTTHASIRLSRVPCGSPLRHYHGRG